MDPALALIELFPQNEDWSLQTTRLLAQIAEGGADLLECARTAARIGSTTDPEIWRREWSATAENLAEFARDQAAHGRRQTAAGALYRACSYFRHSEFFLDSDDPRRIDSYRAGTGCFQEAITLDHGLIERLHVPYEGGQTLDGYIVRPDKSDVRRPTVVFLGGADSWAEELVFLGGKQFPARGMNLVVIDTPGRGSSLRYKQIYSRCDYEVPVSAVFDHLATRADVDVERLGLAGVSLGGYYAPRAAAFEPRVKAVAAWCGVWNVRTDFYDFYPPLQKQLQWITGSASDAEARRKLAEFCFDGIAEKIDVPVLVMHGSEDVVMDVGGAHRFVQALSVDDVTFTVYDGPGALHCSYDHLVVAVPQLADWFADRLR